NGKNGRTVADITLAAGWYGTNQVRRGWKLNRDRDVWKYADDTTDRVNGITKLVFKDLNHKETRLVRIVVRGSGGDYPVRSSDSPLNATVALGDMAASRAGQCGQTAFRSSECLLKPGGRSLACERD